MKNSNCDVCVIHTYARLAARYFLDYITLAESCKEKSGEAMEEEAANIRRHSAWLVGHRLAQRAKRRDLAELVELYWSKFPNVKVIELTPKRLICRAHSCAFYEGFQGLEVDEAQIRGVADLACLPDEAAIAGFNPAIRFHQDRNLMKGDDCCRWILELEEAGHE